ncbi:MAG: hypothetical protein GDA46_06040 [Bdellovibrionales bacterium]|nr:hypothetical protein [Bdellovibrionales bacterium]
MNKKAILFIMTDDTGNCDDVAEYLEKTFPELKNSVLSIHTNKKGEIKETVRTSKNKEELEYLRRQANTIDSLENPYKAIVSVLVLKEGWDVKNVTTLVGLRAYSAKSNILPEQTLGRGLRLMYQNQKIEEKLSVIGTPAFMEFVESIQKEGVKLKYEDMGKRTAPKASLTVEIDSNNPTKDMNKLDISIPVLTPRTYRKYKDLSNLDLSNFKIDKQNFKNFSSSKKTRIDFKYMIQRSLENEEEENEVKEYSHTTILDVSEMAGYENVIGFFSKTIRQELKLVSGYNVIYGKLKEFVKNYLFKQFVHLEDRDTVENLSEPHITRLIIDTFKREINNLTLHEKQEINLISQPISLVQTRAFVMKEQAFLSPKKSVFNKIVGDNNLELEFAFFLDNCNDIVSYVKNYLAVGFKLDYVNHEKNLKNYFPDFLVKKSENEIYVVETKGREDLNDPLKMKRLKQFCLDVSKSAWSVKWAFIFVDEEGFKKYRPTNFQSLINTFTKYQ